jgi:hypothetical protein
MYGFSRQELYTSGPACFMKQDELQRFSAVVAGLRFGEPFRIDNVVHRRKDGTEIIVSVRGKIVMIQNVELAYCTFRDITKRVRLEEEARHIQAKLIHTNKMASLGVLSASIAHESTTPTTSSCQRPALCQGLGRRRKHPRRHHRENGEFVLGALFYRSGGSG